MTTRTTAKVGDAIQLSASFRIDGTLTDMAQVSKVEIMDGNLDILQTITSITRVSTGVYRVTTETWRYGGDFTDVWYFIPVTGAPTETLSLSFSVDAAIGAQTESAPAETETIDIGEENTCIVTATFFTAGGKAKSGVVVSFFPDTPSDLSSFGGLIVEPVHATSDASGEASLRLVRGLTGTLAVTGMGMVRRVVIPDEGTVAIEDLTGIDTDLFDVKNLDDFITLPRTS